MPKHTYAHGFTTELEHITADSSKLQNFTVLYTHGFCSDPWGRKPEETKKWCQKNNIGFFRHELAGHGSDAQNFEKTDINIWKNQILEIIDTMIEGKILVVGASLGGWLSLLAAVHRPERIIGVIGLAAAPDFTAENDAAATPQQRAELEKNGKLIFEDNGFKITITKQLIESGKDNLLLDKPSIDITCPMVLIQGMADESVPWNKALKIATLAKTSDVTVKLLKNSTHRLNDDTDIAELHSALNRFL